MTRTARFRTFTMDKQVRLSRIRIRVFADWIPARRCSGPPFWPRSCASCLWRKSTEAPSCPSCPGDGRHCDAWAPQIAGGQWIGTEIFSQTPLYPYWLAVIFSVAGHDLGVVRLVQAVLGAASCALPGLAGRFREAPASNEEAIGTANATGQNETARQLTEIIQKTRALLGRRNP